MGFIIGLLTFLMVLDCVILIFLVLIQLPKKDAGAGLAFGGGATDALFGAGSGNVLTKVTKYAAVIFFVMAIGLSVLQSHYHRRSGATFGRMLKDSGAATLPSTGAQLPESDATSSVPAAIPAITNVSAGATTNSPAQK